MRKKTVFRFSYFLLLINVFAFAQNKNSESKLTANPVIIIEDDFGNKTVKDWQQSSEVCIKCKNVWSKDSSKIWFQDIESADFNKTIEVFANSNGLKNIEVLAKQSLKKAHLLDDEGHGWVVLASTTVNSENYLLAAILVYGSLDDSIKSTGIHAYLAKETDFYRSGGWVVPASFWLGINPLTDAGDLVRQGKKEPKIQAKIFAKLSDIWIESIYQSYLLQMQVNLKAMHNLRISAIASWDSNAIVIPGNNGYNEIEYKND